MTLGSADDRFLTSAEIRLGKSADTDLADAIFVKSLTRLFGAGKPQLQPGLSRVWTYPCLSVIESRTALSALKKAMLNF
jgi:hypothetical protein